MPAHGPPDFQDLALRNFAPRHMVAHTVARDKVDRKVAPMRTLNRLSAAAVKAGQPGKFSDGGGLWLHRREDGGAKWFLRITVAGRRREMGLGSVSSVSLKQAREEASKWRRV